MFDRYERQVKIKEIGEDGQKKLLDSKVLVVGAGGLGSPAIYYLAAAGIGNIGICDDDTVTLSNLNRQILHFEKDIDYKKTDSAREKIALFSSDVEIQTYDFKIDDRNSEELFKKYDIVLSCVDNFDARNVLNRAHIETKKPLIDAGVNGFSGYVFPIINNFPCYNCVYPKNLSSANTDNGIIGATAGVVGSMQALEAIKTILGLNIENYGHMVFIDLLYSSIQRIKISKNESCACNK